MSEILYKYKIYEGRDTENNFGTQILTQLELHFSKLENLNDPFEGRIPIIYSEETYTIERIKKYLIDTSNSQSQNTTLSEEELNLKAEELYKRDQIENWNQFKDDFYNRNNNFYGILSLTQQYNHHLLWAHYANNHKGYCLGFDKKKLLENLDHLVDCTAGPILKYDKKYPELEFPINSTKKNSIKLLFTKHESWAYEEEFRIVSYNNAGKNFQFSKDILKEIYLGYKISENHKKEIIEILKEKEIKIDLYQMKLSTKEFNLIPKKLDY